ncbi:DUF4870 domain-containing protein [Undibacterium arcticum]|uniref:DUF4870 domain-containing protein n=1 Tax=Undibacterium arcticum TaxID=1762892 RepID=A0ABV7F0N7_9BURK
MNDIEQSNPSKDDCNIAMLAHLLGIFTGFVGALIIWLLKKDSSAFINEEAREALNFQITITIGYLIASVLMFILIGMLLLPILYVANIIFCILGAVATSKGQSYRYPFAVRLVQ